MYSTRTVTFDGTVRKHDERSSGQDDDYSLATRRFVTLSYGEPCREFSAGTLFCPPHRLTYQPRQRSCSPVFRISWMRRDGTTMLDAEPTRTFLRAIRSFNFKHQLSYSRHVSAITVLLTRQTKLGSSIRPLMTSS